jgi:tetratricopeptide (TPR) repeat protein
MLMAQIIIHINNQIGSRNYLTAINSINKLLSIIIKLKTAHDRGILWLEQYCLLSLGLCYYYINEIKKSERSYLQALKTVQEIGDKTSEIRCYRQLSIVYEKGNLEKSIECSINALRIAEQIEDKQEIFSCSFSIGLYLSLAFYYREAIYY